MADHNIKMDNLYDNADKFGAGVTEASRGVRGLLKKVRAAGYAPSKQFTTVAAAMDYAQEIAEIVEPLGGQAQVYSLHFL